MERPPPPRTLAIGSSGGDRKSVYLSCGGIGAAPAAEEYLPLLAPALYSAEGYRLPEHGAEEEARQPVWDGSMSLQPAGAPLAA